ncbi:recombinase family protein [Chitinophaga sedimenti]|nr:recombinase family protein [Chitinophaga sedimenti]MCK7559485.1 recombinase family protein [Chitinophaga sedimenti]
MMLAFFLSYPEVENDRRGLNTFLGMRRARSEGRWTGPAPLGYINRVTEVLGKYIDPVEPTATIIRWVFAEIARGERTVESVMLQAREKGLKCSKNNFWLLIRNPIYKGKIFVPQYKDEPSYFKEGKHERLVSEELFDEVQAVLDGRKRVVKPRMASVDKFPLRGILNVHNVESCSLRQVRRGEQSSIPIIIVSKVVLPDFQLRKFTTPFRRNWRDTFQSLLC